MKVAVSPYLHSVKERLHEEGINVVELDSENMDRISGDVSAIVVSGGDVNMMGMQDIQVEVPIINAEGKTSEDVVSQIKNKLDLYH